MTYGRITRKQAIEIVGQEIVKKAEFATLEPTGRVTDGGKWDGFTEFAGCINLDGEYDEYDNFVMYCYVSNESSGCGDFDDWETVIKETAEYEFE